MLFSFCRFYNLSVRAAENRLKSGIPATIIHGDTSKHQDAPNNETLIFHCVQHFITMMDSLKLNMRAVDELYPTLNELCESLNKLVYLNSDHIVKQKTHHWLSVLYNRKAHEELAEDEVRQMSFELDQAYAAFHKFVQVSRK